MNLTFGRLPEEELDRSKYSEEALQMYDQLEGMAGVFTGGKLVRDGDEPSLANEGVIFHSDTISGSNQAVIVQVSAVTTQIIPLSEDEAVSLAKAILQEYGVSYRPRKG